MLVYGKENCYRADNEDARKPWVAKSSVCQRRYLFNSNQDIDGNASTSRSMMLTFRVGKGVMLNGKDTALA